MIKSDTQPLCRWCGKPLRKYTERRHPSPQVLGFDDPNLRAMEDCQRRENQRVVSVQYRWDYDRISDEKIASSKRIHSYAVWDGVSYEAVLGFFCTNNCAMYLGQSAARDHNLAGIAYNEAVRKTARAKA